MKKKSGDAKAAEARKAMMERMTAWKDIINDTLVCDDNYHVGGDLSTAINTTENEEKNTKVDLEEPISMHKISWEKGMRFNWFL